MTCSNILLPAEETYLYAPNGQTVEAIVSWWQENGVWKDSFWLPFGQPSPDLLSLSSSTFEVVETNFLRLRAQGELAVHDDVLGDPGIFYVVDDRRPEREQMYMVQCGQREGMNFPPDTPLVFVGDPTRFVGVHPLSRDELIALIDHPDTVWLEGKEDPFRPDLAGKVVVSATSLLQ